MTKIKTYWESITPERAAALLKLNTNNRSVRKAWVQTLARMMKDGQWNEDGNTIKFNCHQLLDGQHRLMACIASGVPFRTLVVEGVETAAMNAMDYVKARNAADYLHFQGEKNTFLTTASLSLLDRYFTSRLRTESLTYTPQDIAALLEKHPEMRKSVTYAANKSTLLAGSIVAVAHYLLTTKAGEEGLDFMEKLLHGANISETSSIYTLRERLMVDATRGRTKRSIQNQADRLVYIIKAWNATRRGDTIKVYLWRQNEDAPVVAA